eukprot:481392_1
MTSSFYSIVSQLFESIASNDKNADKKPNNSMDYKNEILSTNFNQDNTCISVATRNGFRIFQCKPFTKAFESIDNNISCRSVSMLFATSLVALIGNNNIKHSSLRNVKLYNTKDKQELCRLNFKSTVLSVKLNKKRLAVCVENKIHIFDLINNMKQIYEITTYNNNNGAFDLCCDNDNNLLAYPNKSKCGSIGILDAYNLQKRTIINAHDSQLQIIKFNPDGNYLCTASTIGTIIRIFSIPKGQLIYTFRRGIYASNILSISFNLSSTLLAVTSTKSSIHIFDLINYKRKQLFSQQNINNYLPQSVKNEMEHRRSIITINHKHHNSIIKSLKCGWFNDYTLLCATENGYFYRYSINDKTKQYKLLSEHTLKDNKYDLHKEQKTKIYRNTTKKVKSQHEITVTKDEI